MMRDLKNATVYREMMEMMMSQWIPGEGYHVCYECHSLRLPVFLELDSLSLSGWQLQGFVRAFFVGKSQHTRTARAEHKS
jgi:hypothetical protein